MEDTYAYVVVVGRNAQRRPLTDRELNLLTGNYDRLSDRALRDAVNDLTHEQYRRMNG